MIESFPSTIIYPEILIQTSNLPKYRVRNSEITKIKNRIRPKVYKQIQGYQRKSVDHIVKAHMTQSKFLNKFYIYNGMSRN